MLNWSIIRLLGKALVAGWLACGFAALALAQDNTSGDRSATAEATTANAPVVVPPSERAPEFPPRTEAAAAPSASAPAVFPATAPAANAPADANAATPAKDDTEAADDTGSDDTSVPVMEIKPSESNPSLYSIELRNTALLDLFRLMAHDYNLNIMVDERVSGNITASLTNISLEEALQTIVTMKNLAMEKKGNIILVKPALVTRIFKLEHIQVDKIVVQEATVETTNQQSSALALAPAAPAGGAAPTAPAPPLATGQQNTKTTYKTKITFASLLSKDASVMSDKQSNSIMVVDYPENLIKVEEYIKMVDKAMDSFVFRLKYISAKEMMGQLSAAQAAAAAKK